MRQDPRAAQLEPNLHQPGAMAQRAIGQPPGQLARAPCALSGLAGRPQMQCARQAAAHDDRRSESRDSARLTDVWARPNARPIAALLYPAALARLVASWPHDRDRAAARGALASGVAIGGAPFLLAALADAFGLRAAYLIVPGLLVVLVLLTTVSMRSRTRQPV